MPFVVRRFLVRRMLHVVLHGCAMGKLGMEVVARTSRSHIFIQQNDDQTAIGWLKTGGWSEKGALFYGRLLCQYLSQVYLPGLVIKIGFKGIFQDFRFLLGF